MFSQVLSDNLIKNMEEGWLKNCLETVLPEVISFFWCVVLALITVYVGTRIIRFVRKFFHKSMEHHNFEEGVKQKLKQVNKYLL